MIVMRAVVVVVVVMHVIVVQAAVVVVGVAVERSSSAARGLVDLVDGAKRALSSAMLVRVALCAVSLAAKRSVLLKVLNARPLAVASFRVEAQSVEKASDADSLVAQWRGNALVELVVAHACVALIFDAGTIARNASLALTGKTSFTERAIEAVFTGSFIWKRSGVLADGSESVTNAGVLARSDIFVAHVSKVLVDGHARARTVADVLFDARARASKTLCAVIEWIRIAFLGLTVARSDIALVVKLRTVALRLRNAFSPQAYAIHKTPIVRHAIRAVLGIQVNTNILIAKHVNRARAWRRAILRGVAKLRRLHHLSVTDCQTERKKQQ